MPLSAMARMTTGATIGARPTPAAFSATSSRSDDMRPKTIMTAASRPAGIVSVRISGMPSKMSFTARNMGRSVYIRCDSSRKSVTVISRKVSTPTMANVRSRTSR